MIVGGEVVGIAGKGEEIVGASMLLEGRIEEGRKYICLGTISKDESCKVLLEVVICEKRKKNSH